MAKLILGCGFLGLRVARRWLEMSQTVFAVTRSPERAARLKAEGMTPVIADVTDPASLADLPKADTVLYAVGFDRQGGHPIRDVYVDGPSHVWQRLSDRAQRIIYISTTGVHGQDSREPINESSPCAPRSEAARAHLDAERALRQHPLGQQAIILRMAGLYGPGRLPRKADLFAQRPTSSSPEGMINLIHIDDAASAVLAAEQVAEPPRTYLISDGSPLRRRDFLEEMARLVGAPPPQFVAESQRPVNLRGASDKRISNRRMLEELHLKLRYSTYREGLAGSMSHDNI